MADKPGHVIEIPASLGRDVDKARAGKLKGDLPVEAFMTDAALAQVEQQTRAATLPVHAEQLVPISRAEAARRTTFNGETLPDVPQARRVIPPPFRRPRIDAGSHGKTWQFVPATEVVKGDLVPDVGLVEENREETVYATRGEILGHETVHGVLFGRDGAPVQDPAAQVAVGVTRVLIGGDGNVKAFREKDMVRVFRKAPQP